MQKKIIFLFLTVILSLLFIATVQVDQAVVFGDSNLELAIRQKLNHYGKPVYRSQVLNILELDLSGRRIEHLDGIEHFRNIEVLNLSQNKINDFSQLETLTNLQILNIARNNIINLEKVNFRYISSLQLVDLDLSYNSLSCVRLLEGMTSLERLNLAGNQIADLEPISALVFLRELDLSSNNLNSIDGLTLYMSLDKLVLRDNDFTDISEFEKFENLVHLNLRENRIKEISNIGKLKELSYLNLHSNTDIEDFSPLANLIQLNELILRNVPIGEQISYIKDLKNLHRLNLRNAQIIDVSAIIYLMELGVLQDREHLGILAEVNLLENDLEEKLQYHMLRPYWSRVTYRWPFSLPVYHRTIAPPSFSHVSGFSSNGFYLSLSTDNSNKKIYYTLDGSEPIIDHNGRPLGATLEYKDPIWIINRMYEPNILSEIKTSPLDIGNYSPPSEIFKATIIRTIAIDNNGNASNIVTHTFFIDEDIVNRYSLPIVSLITDPEGFFDDKVGIYALGVINESNDNNRWSPANYHQRGIKWERLAKLQLVMPDGNLHLSQNIGVRIHGGASRAYPKKSLRIYAGESYDPEGLLTFSFFPALGNRFSDKNVDTFSTLILRTGGNDDEWLSMMRDVVAHSLLENTKLDIQGNFPVILFLNGEYWGLYNFRTRYDDHYFESYYGIDPENIVLLEGVGSEYNILKGDIEDAQSYEELLNLVMSSHQNVAEILSDIGTDEDIYNEVSLLMDIDNYIDYYISQIYFNKGDLIRTNVRFWRKKLSQESNTTNLYGHDGKWRWMVIDVDYGLRNPEENLFYELTKPDGKHYFNQPHQTILFRSLLNNRKFSTYFINRFSDHLNTTFREKVVIDQIERWKMIYYPEVDEQIHRWGNAGGSIENWQKEVDKLVDFARLRPTYQRKHISDYFDLSGTAHVTTSVNPKEGFITINSIDIIDSTAGVADPGHWTGIYFQDVPITITATPYEDYQFSHWEGVDLLDVTEESITITLHSDATIKAVFEPIQ